MSKLPFNPTGNASDQHKAHTPDQVCTDDGWTKGNDVPEQDDTAHPEDYARPEVDSTRGRRGSTKD